VFPIAAFCEWQAYTWRQALEFWLSERLEQRLTVYFLVIGVFRLSLFVQGPQADTTEEAMRGLLSKIEEMIGKRWAGKVVLDKDVYVEP
jgi:hypothetical protein